MFLASQQAPHFHHFHFILIHYLSFYNKLLLFYTFFLFQNKKRLARNANAFWD
ncbi:Predicted protein [Anoxybacillus flavithermus WK1]|uniref:Uncharacterized protein n=1 Tax=Anoxybacillus flavithermus (strain DSM 21510 / WK1) TaxID=491915 RepID=B7GJW2_ANOFW|nr:Predicted protein [Anoxybacillus flavithermus WK1]